MNDDDVTPEDKDKLQQSFDETVNQSALQQLQNKPA